ncbi:sugar transferase [Nesterenkonia ebinurensis]|uniref:sugar transferase n=1 Tax=Nesterenkonia ebinurensis TaxID=2608252 RepID=UPI00123D4BA6|nr:sugar transferase [Nesterenkonia ebinurensis]
MTIAQDARSTTRLAPRFALGEADAPQSARPSWKRAYARRLVVTDVLALVAVFAAVQITWLSIGESAYFSLISGQAYGTVSYGVVSAAIVALWLLLLWLSGSRAPRVVGVGWMEYRLIANWGIRLFAGIATAAFLLKMDLGRGYILLSIPLGIIGLWLSRLMWRKWLQRQRKKGNYSHQVVLAGSPASVQHIADQLQRQPAAGYQVVGICLPEHAARLTKIEGAPVIGTLMEIPQKVESVSADTVIITSADDLDPLRVKELSWELEQGAFSLVVAPSLTDVAGPRIHSRPVAGLPLLHVETPQYSGFRAAMKRISDVALSAAALLALAIPMLIVALLVKTTSPGPVFFMQERVGYHGKPFKMFKFRSMRQNAEELLTQLDEKQKIDQGSVLFKIREDPRITRVGKFIRRYSIDELPQLINVLKGDMSLVGPRPSLAREVELYDPHVHRRFLVKPGITGLWQVSGRSDLSWEESVRLDLYYVENWSLTADLMILWRTARAVVSSSGAY